MKQETFDSALRSTWQIVSKMYNKEASKFDSTMATGFALLSIDSEGTPSTTLGPKMGMESTSLSRLLNSMEERNLIYRSQHPKDGRSVLIHLTEFGVEKREDSKAVVLHFNEEIEKSLSQKKIQHFFEVMQCIKEKASEFEHFSTPTLKTT
ncbi:MarR family transcriptional regulator [Flavobacteriaceae bacterium]|jgi:DNA-binding MarR family transcriptional regulator|nr:MarR family transcriptional regulator [Flavobacteriaceae bacterium]MDA8644320.1 MarR family transcriptional regulator [Flavobacteriaceae bacterium]MDA8877509.1 MarR family transcriptional regulator [Flavobacteriaceae bacterium]MDC0871796.1 MarR family transcriptional regulator [Flavobacteriaceae bacterium]